MKKKTTYLLLAVLLSPLFAWAQYPEQTQDDFSLYDFTRKEISSYYRPRRNFADPGHSSGWYRVDNFLNWVEQNEAVLTQIFKQKYVDNYTSFPPQNQEDLAVLAGFLGVYYTASHCQHNLKQVHYIAIVPGFNSSAGTREMQVAVNDSFVQIVNSGLHEGAHMLPSLCEGRIASSPSDNLSELVPLSAQLVYGLPTKMDDTPQGTRQIANDLRSQNESLSTIYTQELLAFLQQKTLSRFFNSNDLRPLMNAKLEKSSFTLNAFITDLIDVKQGKLSENGIPLSLSEYLQLIHVQQEELNNVASFVEDFLNQLNNKAPLPKRLKQRQWNAFSDKYDAYLEKNTQAIKSILLNLVQQYPAPPTPSGFQ